MSEKKLEINLNLLNCPNCGKECQVLYDYKNTKICEECLADKVVDCFIEDDEEDREDFVERLGELTGEIGDCSEKATIDIKEIEE